jgi:hypothetical protein
MTDEQRQCWRKIVTKCQRWAPVTIGSPLRYESILAADDELRQLRRRVAELEGEHDSRQIHQEHRAA